MASCYEPGPGGPGWQLRSPVNRWLKRLDFGDTWQKEQKVRKKQSGRVLVKFHQSFTFLEGQVSAPGDADACREVLHPGPRARFGGGKGAGVDHSIDPLWLDVGSFD